MAGAGELRQRLDSDLRAAAKLSHHAGQGDDQATDGGPAVAAGPPLPVGVELREACPLLARTTPMNATQARLTSAQANRRLSLDPPMG